MVDHTHPITPPPELVRQWRDTYFILFPDDEGVCPVAIDDARDEYIATQAAQWGADAELEACCEWLPSDLTINGESLRAARRPKPPSLAEEGLEALEQIDGWAVANMNHLSIHDDLVTGVEAIRRALERLQQLEQQENNDN